MAVGDKLPVLMKSEFDNKVNFADIDTKTGTSIQSTVADDYIVELTKIEGATQVTKATLVFTATTIATTGSDFTGFIVNDTITISGCATSANNTTAVITAIAAKVITCGASSFTAVTENGDVSITNGTVTYSTAISPSNIATITNAGDVAFDVLACGKNLFDLQGFIFTHNVTSVTKISDGFTVQKTGTAGAYLYAVTEISLIPNTSYVVKASNVVVRSGVAKIYGRNTSDVNLANHVEGSSSNNYTCSFTTDSTGKTRLKFYVTWDAANLADIDFRSLMLEQGIVASTYEAYKSNKLTVPITYPLRKLPNGVCDTIEKQSDGKWYYVQRVGKVVLNGNESGWALPETLTNTLRFTCTNALSGARDIDTYNKLCDKFKHTLNSDQSDYEHTRNPVAGSQNIFILYINKTRLSSQDVAGFKTWLTSNNLTVYYELATPVTTLLSYDTVLTSYKGITNVLSTANPQPLITGAFKSRLKNSVEVLYGMPATNLLTNTDLNNGTAGWVSSGLASLSVYNNELMCLADSLGDYARQIVTTVSGHIYYSACYVKTNSNLVRHTFGASSKFHSGSNNYERLSVIYTANETSNLFSIVDTRASGWSIYYMRNAICLDLTEIFGTGNEPSLAEIDFIISKFTNSWFRDTVNPLLTHKELMNYLNKNKANIKQEDWLAPTLVNGWVEVSGYPVRYMKDNMGFVHLKGRLQTGATGNQMFVLPTGYRPLVETRFMGAQGSGGYELFILYNTGYLYAFTSYSSYVCLDGIVFKAEQ